MKYPKVLVAGPTSESKMYCWEEWYNNVMLFTYPNFSVFIADNSKTSENTDYLNSFDGVTAVWTEDRGEGFLELVNDSELQIRDYAIKNKFDYILHLETDVIPPYDIIERLMVHQRPICAAVYDIFFGSKRKPMIQMKEGYERTLKGYNVVDFCEEEEPCYYDGKVREVFHAGLGCILLHIDIVKLIPFRVDKTFDMHTDTWFASDCFQADKDIYIDTDVQCEHRNINWLSKIDKIREHVQK